MMLPSRTLKLFILNVVVVVLKTVECKSPNILLIVADDLGYNDVSWHNEDIKSPNLDNLARNGIILENYYVQPICTPTRAALMTGYYPIHTGRQHSVLWPQEPRGLFTNFTLMPEYLKRLGYKTHIVGKWHLGFCNEAYLPTRRGFDSFYGFYSGSEDYFSHRRQTLAVSDKPGYDFRDNDDVAFEAAGTYSSFLFANRSVDIILDHANSKTGQPLFLYLPLQDVHTPMQVPQKYLNLYPHIKNKDRKILSAKVSALDDVVGRVVNGLKQAGLFENTLIIFTSDNGGQTLSGGNNYPLRGNKGTLWEGGTRAAAFMHWPKMKNAGSIFNGLMHVTDWIPTLISAVNGNFRESRKMDGIDIWPSFATGQDSPRKEMLYNIDPYNGDNKFGTQRRNKNAAIRVGHMKLIVGDPGSPSGWIPSPTNSNNLTLGAPAFSAVKSNDVEQIEQIRLYNLLTDPYERVNLASRNRDIVDKLMSKLAVYEASMIPPDVTPEIKAGNPNRFGGVWSSGWCSAQPLSNV